MKKQSTWAILRHQLFSLDFWAHLLFWSWNAIFLTFMILGFAPTVLPEMLTAVEGREIPASFLLYALLLTLVPLLMSAAGIYLRQEPSKLLTLGYGLEGPLMIMLAVRFFIVRQLTVTMSIILALTIFGLLTLLWQLFDRKIDKRPRWLTAVRLVGLSLLLLIGLYASIWLAFYALPLGALFLAFVPEMVREVGRSLLNGEWRWIPFMLLFFTTFMYSASLFVLMPLAVPIIYIRSWWEAWRTMRLKSSPLWASGLTAVTIVAALATLALSESHPQQQAFAQLEEPPQSIADARALLAEETQLREGLLNAYLAQYRYFSAAGEVDHIRQLYEDAFDLPRDNARSIQGAYELLARPLLYQPVRRAKPDAQGHTWSDSALRREPTEAAELYETYFDRPITDGERDTIITAVRNTWALDQARANVQAVDDREIWLAEQAINITENGDWANVELYEVYVNQTSQRQEVVYYFSLPEAAVLTGLWLGNSPQKESAFTHQVAPRGAAQATYRNEVQRNVDPALLEQIGPRQYRLRVFPIEPRQWDWDSNTGRSRLLAAPPLHLWLTYRTLGVQGRWPLPQLAEKRNVYWTDDTERRLNGLTWPRTDEAWLPTAVPATFAIEPEAHRVSLPDGRVVWAAPTQTAPSVSDEARLALVLDRSRSMVDYEAEIAAELDALRELTAGGANVDVILTATAVRGEGPTVTTLDGLDEGNLFYFGGQNAADLLIQFDQLAGDEAYDAVLVLTDDSGYKLLADGLTVPIPSAPVWMIHLGGLSLGYDDATLEAIQASGGGTAVSVREAWQRWATPSGDLLDGYSWQVFSPAEADAHQAQFTAENTAVVVQEHDTNSPFMPLAVRRLILHEMAQNQGDLSQLATLDALHDLAVQHSIVTPYSSMIVLINDRQQQLLNELSAGDDRFEREYEAVGETAGEQLTVTGVPEPHEWLLLSLGLVLLVVYFWRQRPELAFFGRSLSR